MKKVLFFLLLLVVALAVVPLFLPKTMYVEEEYVYDADVSDIFEQFYDMQKYTRFDPWVREDSLVKITYSSPSSGPNAYYNWESEVQDLGSGKMQIVDSRLEEFISYDITYDQMEGNTADIIFHKLDDNKTRVIWSFESAEADYPFQVFNWIMKSSVQDKIHQGLVNLDTLLKENQNSENKDPYTIKNVIDKRLFGVLQSTSIDDEEIFTAKDETLGFVRSYLIDAQKLEEKNIGNPVVYWKMYDLESQKAMFYCGYFIQKDVPEVDGMEYIELKGGRVINAVHNGSYRNLPNTYEAIKRYGESKGLELSPEWYNVYLNSPDHVKTESELRTEVNIPIIE
ncbi:MAG: GyrI-like domain-containing protein [Weeksellaceae bacterium]